MDSSSTSTLISPSDTSESIGNQDFVSQPRPEESTEYLQRLEDILLEGSKQRIRATAEKIRSAIICAAGTYPVTRPGGRIINLVARCEEHDLEYVENRLQTLRVFIRARWAEYVRRAEARLKTDIVAIVSWDFLES
jgi:hypothetical protein